MPEQVFNVLDYGATANDQTVDSQAIQNAIKAANAAWQANPSGGPYVVQIPAGTFLMAPLGTDQSDGCIEMLSGVTVRGAGMGETVLKVKDNVGQQINGTVRTPYGEETRDCALLDLTIDGNRAGNGTTKINGFFCGTAPGSTKACENILLDRVEIANCSGYGFDPHEITKNLTIQNSVAHHNGLDGFVADYIVGGVYRNNLAYANDRHGFNIVTSTTGLLMEGNVGRDNGGTGLTIQRGSDPSYVWTNAITVRGDDYYNNGRAGVEVKLSRNVTLEDLDVYGNGREGIRLSGAEDVTISGSRLSNNAQSRDGYYNEISVFAQADSFSGQTFPSRGATITGNTILADGAVRAGWGIFEGDGSTGVQQSGNVIDGMRKGDVSIDGVASDDGAAPGGPSGGPGQLVAGGEGGQSLAGTAGDDTIDGGSGADTMAGGAGHDVYRVDDAGDRVVEAGGAGIDRVEASVGHTLGSGVENLTLTGSADIDGTGNLYDNALLGNGGANVLRGGAGADTIDGGGGADTLEGGSGNDVFFLAKGGIAAGETILDFVGNGAGAGDRIVFTGFGPGATLSNAGGDLWRVEDADGAATFRIAGVTTLHGTDYAFSGDGTAPAQTFNVMDFGAKGDGTSNDQAAIKAAIQAAHAAGGGTVYLPPGTYRVGLGGDDASDGPVELLSGVTLKGAGQNATVIKLMDNVGQAVNGLVRTPFNEVTKNVGLSDLTIDGNRAANGDVPVNGFFCGVAPGSPLRDEDITVTNVTVRNCNGYGFDPHEQTVRLRIENCTAHGNLTDGFVADYLIDSVFANNTAYNNGRHGFNVTTATQNFLMHGNVAHDNGGSGIIVQRGSDASIPVPKGIDIVGGEIYRNGRAGIELRLTDDVSISGVSIHDNAREGVRLSGATNVSITGSTIADNSAAGDGAFNAIGIFAEPNGGAAIPSASVSITNNTIRDAGAPASGWGIFENDGSTGVTHSGNAIDGMKNGDVLIDGLAYDQSGAPTGGGAPITGTSGADSRTGTAGNDSIAGLGGNDTLQGLGGDDTLDGGSGSDSLVGGAGNDTYFVNTSTDAVVEAAGGGTDSVVSQFTHTLAANVENLTVTAEYSVDSTGVRRNVNATGNDLANVVAGSIGANLVRGLGGDDTLDGGAGADTLDGGLGADRLTGGAGDDLFDLDKGAANGDVVVDFAAGDRIDLSSYGSGATLSQALSGTTLTATLTYTGGAESFTVLNLGRELAAADLVFTGTYGGGSAPPPPPPPPGTGMVLTGTSGADSLAGGDGNDSLSGASSDDTLDGGGGNDTLDGGSGNDSMVGGAGDDAYVTNSSSDIVAEAAGGGRDTVRSVYTRTLAENCEVLELTGSSAINGYGNAGANLLQGNGAANRLEGRDGADELLGLGGADTLLGGLGADTLAGGDGADIFLFRPGEVQGDSVADYSGAGGDILRFSGFAGGSIARTGTNTFTVTYDGGKTETLALNVDSLAGAKVEFTA